MPNVMTVLKDEIVRLAKKEVKASIEPLRDTTGAVRKTLSDLSKRVVALEKALNRITKASIATDVPAATTEADAGDPKARITAKGIRSLRRKLGLTRKALGALLGVSEQNIYLWERKEGPLRVREATRKAILGIRGVGVREAKQRLSAAEASPDASSATATNEG